MLAAIPAHEMAETLCIIAGSNAGNAARHFGRQSYAAGDIASAVLWSSIAQTLDRMESSAHEPEEKPAMHPVPRPMTDGLEATGQEATVFQDLRFEDVDADTLIRETLQETLTAISVAEASNPEPAAGFTHAEYGAAHAAQDVPGRPRKLELVSARAAGDTPSRRSPSPIWARIVKQSSRRAA